MTILETHVIADIFPLMSTQEFDDLVRDIRLRGQREPIRLYEGQILDGCNRYRACQQLDIEPATLDLSTEATGECRVGRGM